MRIRVLLADRELIIREGVRILLEREGVNVVGEAADIDQAVRLAAELQPQVVVLEGYRPGGRESLEATRRLTAACPQVKAVILTHAAPWADVDDAMQAGVRGYVLTSQRASELAQAIRDVARGATYFASKGGPVAPTPVVVAAKDPLTPRERQVLRLIAQGRTTKEIAAILCRSTKTADAHRTRLMEKLDIHHVAGLVRYAIRRGLIDA